MGSSNGETREGRSSQDGTGKAPNIPSSRVDRLLRERIRKSRSSQALEECEDVDDGVDYSEYAATDRLMVVANRLPVTCSKDSSGKWKLQVSAGGLVSALMGVSNYTTIWIGWPGIYVRPGKDREALTQILNQEGYVPVWLDPQLLDLYYNGFCNSVLWQLFHYVPLNLDSWQHMTEHHTVQMQWQAYQSSNQKFAEVVLKHYQQGDIVWVQDYHLMLLPSLLKQEVPKMKVGWFLHTPFPSSEIYRTLPVREEVLRAVLGADLIAFHTYDYARHFISSCTRILGLEGTPEGVEDNGSLTRIAAFPIGIDPERFLRALETEEVQMNISRLLNRYAGRKVMLGVDRLDMIKGIPQKLLAYERFLEDHPEWQEKVLLVQIAVPSRTDVPEYQKLRSMVHEIVGRINGQFSTLTYVPIHHLDRQLSFTELCALYAVTDVALVTSLRDGMNLVSYEYVACQSDNAGVLILSEFAGAAQSLGAGAILVNPWNINDMAQALEDALTMSEEERRERHRQNYMHVATHTAQTWADTFISELNDTHIEADIRLRHAPPPLAIAHVVDSYKQAKRRLIVLGYNATLTTNVETPRQVKRHYDQIKAVAKVNPRIYKSIQELSSHPQNVVVIFSGSECSKLEECFGHLNVWMAAENGVYLHPPLNCHLHQKWICLFESLPKDWMEAVQLVFDYFCERTPRSVVETRDTSLVWNYKHADLEFGRVQARDMLQHLWTGPISNAPVEIIQGGKSVEVRPVGVTKGLCMQRAIHTMSELMGNHYVDFDFVLCIGHLLSRDENIYTYFEGQKFEGHSMGASANQPSSRSTAMPMLTASDPQDLQVPPLLANELDRLTSQDDLRITNHVTNMPPHKEELVLPPMSRMQEITPPLQDQVLGSTTGGVHPAGHRHAKGQHQEAPTTTRRAHPLRTNSFQLSRLSHSHIDVDLSTSPSGQDAVPSASQGGPPPTTSRPPSRQSSTLDRSEDDRGVTTSLSYDEEGAYSHPFATLLDERVRRTTGRALPDQPRRHSFDWASSRQGSAHLDGLPPSQRHLYPYHYSLSQSHQRDGHGYINGREAPGVEGGRTSQCFPPPHLYTCSVGRNRSKARFSLQSAHEVAELLSSMVREAVTHLEPAPSGCSLASDASLQFLGSQSSLENSVSPETSWTSNTVGTREGKNKPA